jgi:hypothetical protein
MANAGEQRDEFIRFQAETKVRMENLEYKQDELQDEITGVKKEQVEIKITLGSIVSRQVFGALVGGGIATFAWALFQHFVLKGK